MYHDDFDPSTEQDYLFDDRPPHGVWRGLLIGMGLTLLLLGAAAGCCVLVAH